MRQYERNGVVVDQCGDCRGIFLDRGELERLVDAEKAWRSAAPTAQAPPPQYGAPAPHYGSAQQYPPGQQYGSPHDQRGHDQRGHDQRRHHDDDHKKHKKHHDSFFEDLFG